MRWGLGLALLFGAAALFFVLARDVWLRRGLAWDLPLMTLVYGWRHPWLDLLVRWVTHSGSGFFVAPLTLAGLYWLWRRGRRLAALTLLAGVAGAGLLDTTLKLVFARPRPDVFPPLVAVSSYSFPSGHTLLAVALYGLFAVWSWRRQRRVWALLGVAWVLLVAFSRVYLGVHFPSDVLASLALGSVWLRIVLAGHDRAARHAGSH